MNTFAPFRITVCGIEELSGHCDAKVSHVLSLLDPEWPVPEVFGTFGEHAKLKLRFHDIIDERNADMIAPGKNTSLSSSPSGADCWTSRERMRTSLSTVTLAFPDLLPRWH